MAAPEHVWLRASRAVGEWLDVTPERVSMKMLGPQPPFTVRKTEGEAMEFWRDKLFTQDGTPKPAETGKFMQDRGAGDYALLVTRLKKRGLLDEVQMPGTTPEPVGLPPVPEPTLEPAPPVQETAPPPLAAGSY